MLKQASRKRSKQDELPVKRGRFVCETGVDEHDRHAHNKPPVVKVQRPAAPIQCPGARKYEVF